MTDTHDPEEDAEQPDGPASMGDIGDRRNEATRHLWQEFAQTLARAQSADVLRMNPETLAQLDALGERLLGNLHVRDIQVEKLLPDLRTKLPVTFWDSFEINKKFAADAGSIASLYTSAQLATAAEKRKALAPRPSRTAEAFFGKFVVEIDSVQAMLTALARVQAKHHEHQLVWRGQQDATWAMHSSLHRKLAKTGDVDEDRLIEAEQHEMAQAKLWGIRTLPAGDFFAQLQHHGAPTRLIDVSLDPEMAFWFGVEEHPKRDEKDGLVFAWGRAPRVKKSVQQLAEFDPGQGPEPLWHEWCDDQARATVGWGTGTRTWPWFPPALSDRMRAQRAGFLLEAGPILTDEVVDVFNERLEHPWTAEEISRVTSVVGLPSRHDVLTRQNGANLVPVFTFRILRQAKPLIREYLERKGLQMSRVYPDLGGLVQRLRGHNDA